MTEGVVETGSAGTDEKGTDAGIFWVTMDGKLESDS